MAIIRRMIYWKLIYIIISNSRPDRVNLNDCFYKSNIENLRTAFSIGEKEFGIAKILDPEDVDIEHADERSIMTYISMMFNTIPNVPMHPSDLKLESVWRFFLNFLKNYSKYIIIKQYIIMWYGFDNNIYIYKYL